MNHNRKLEAKIQDGNLVINLNDLVTYTMTDEEAVLLAESLSICEHVILSTVEFLATGSTPQGFWSSSTSIPNYLEKGRLKLAELHTSLDRYLVQELVKDRDDLLKEKKRFEEWSWKLYRMLTDSGRSHGLPEIDKFEYVPTRTGKQIDAVLAALEAEKGE